MKRLSLIITALLMTLTISAQGISFEPDGTTLEQASVKAKAQNKLIFLDCYTSWCGPCKKMARDVFPQAVCGDYMNPKFISIKIDMESAYGAPLAKKLQITAYPTFVIFNADAKEIGRFLGGSSAEEFIRKVGEKSKDNSSSTLEERWNNGDRDQAFLMQYLQSLNASYKNDQADLVAEAILEGKEATFANDSTLRMVFMGSINNPFASSFKYTVQHPEALKAAIGDTPVDMKIANVLNNYPRQLINEHDGTATLDQANFDKYVALLKELNYSNADHYRLTTLITLAEKQKDYDSYIKYIKEYLANPALDADDMTLCRWVKPFTEPGDSKYKAEMKSILQARLDDLKSGKRQPQNKIGNMTLSVPTDKLIERVIGALDGKMPGQ